MAARINFQIHGAVISADTVPCIILVNYVFDKKRRVKWEEMYI